jgi:hypothetical protein
MAAARTMLPGRADPLEITPPGRASAVGLKEQA